MRFETTAGVGVSRVLKWREYLLRAVIVRDSFKIVCILLLRRSFEVGTNKWSVQNSGSYPGMDHPGLYLGIMRTTRWTVDTKLMHFHAWSSLVSKCKVCLLPLLLSSLWRTSSREQMCPNAYENNH